MVAIPPPGTVLYFCTFWNISHPRSRQIELPVVLHIRYTDSIVCARREYKHPNSRCGGRAGKTHLRSHHVVGPPELIVQGQVDVPAAGRGERMHALESACGLAPADPVIDMVNPPAALPLGGTVAVVAVVAVVVVAIRLEDDLVRPDARRLVRIEHPARVRKALRGGLEDEFLVRGFVDRVREDVETEGDEAGEEAREVLHLA